MRTAVRRSITCMCICSAAGPWAPWFLEPECKDPRGQAMKKKKGGPVKSRAAPRRLKKKQPAHAAKSMSRLRGPRDAGGQGPGGPPRRELYPAIEPFRHGYLRVS